MTKLPELPRTDDPFALLGVAPGVDERQLKRAYVQLIKVYRPERAAKEFQRIRSAYETARARLLEPGDATSPPPVPELAAMPEQDSKRAESFDNTPVVTRWQPLQETYDGWTVEQLVNSVLDGQPAAEALLLHPDDWQWQDFPQLEAVDWQVLARQPDRQIAAELLLIRFEHLLHQGQFEQVVNELAAPELVRDALKGGHLETVAFYVASVLAWPHTEAAERIYESYIGTPGRTSLSQALDRLYFVLSQSADDWRLVMSEAPAPEALADFLYLGPFSGFPRLSELAADVVRDLAPEGSTKRQLRVRRRAYLKTLDATLQQDKHPADLLRQLVTGGDDDLADETDTEELENSPWTSHLKVPERFVNRWWGRFHAWHDLLSGCLLLLGVPILMLGYGWLKGGVIGFAILLAVVLPFNSLAALYYRKVVRRRLLDIMLDSGRSASWLEQLLTVHQDEFPGLAYFCPHITQDEALTLVGGLAGLSRQVGPAVPEP